MAVGKSYQVGLTIMKSKLKSRTQEFDVLSPVEPDIVGQSTGNQLYFPMIPFFHWVKLAESAKKVILLRKVPKMDWFLTRIFQKYWTLNRGKAHFSIFGLVHVDLKLHEDFGSDLAFSNFSRKSGQKRWFTARFGYISMHSKTGKLVMNQCFWPLLHQKFEKIRSDSESSCNFTSTCTKPKIEKWVFPWSWWSVSSSFSGLGQKINLKNEKIWFALFNQKKDTLSWNDSWKNHTWIFTSPVKNVHIFESWHIIFQVCEDILYHHR